MTLLDSWITSVYSMIKNTIQYTPPQVPDRFVLDEHRPVDRPQEVQEDVALEQAGRELNTLLRHARRLAKVMEQATGTLQGKKSFAIHKQTEITEKNDTINELREQYLSLSKQQLELDPILLSYDSSKDQLSRQKISASLEENKRTVEGIYNLPQNKDVGIRMFEIVGKPKVKAMLVFLDGMSDKTIINEAVLKPLMLLGDENRNLYANNLISTIMAQSLPSQAVVIDGFVGVQDAVNGGDTIVFFEGIPEAIVVETKGWEHRGVSRPFLEQSARGGQESFSNVLRVNTALIRASFRSSDLMTEMVTVGVRSRVNCAVMYLKSVANPELVAEVKRRIIGVKVDYIGDISVLDHFIEDHPNNPFPVSLNTERIDRVTAHLAEGRIAVMIEGSSFANVLPASIYTLLHTSEDFIIKFPHGTLIRILRLIAMFVAMTLPSWYLAITTFHQEAIPTDLLLAIAVNRVQVPFPSLVEILGLELVWELIREGVLRIPGMLGPTIGVVGAIILGQAIVQAKIVSPLVVIVVALTGVASFVIPDYRLSVAIRMMRFIFLGASAVMGLVGLATVMILLHAFLANMKSYGVSYLAPFAPKVVGNQDDIHRAPVAQQDKRPDVLNPQDVQRQPRESKPWMKDIPEGKDDKW